MHTIVVDDDDVSPHKFFTFRRRQNKQLDHKNENETTTMKYNTTFITISLLLWNGADSFTTTSSSNIQHHGLHSRGPAATTTNNKPSFQSPLSLSKLTQRRQTPTTPTTTSLSMLPVPVGAIAGALTGGLLGGALHAIAGKFFRLRRDFFVVDAQTDRLPRSQTSRVVAAVLRSLFYFLLPTAGEVFGILFLYDS